MIIETHHTMILIGDESVARVDLPAENSGDLIWSSRLERPEYSGLGESVALALADGPQISGRVWVLTEEVWSGTVTLENEIVKAIPAGQLDLTLALQAEEESGISPFDSRLGHVSLSNSGRKATWWVVQAEQTQLDDVAQAISRCSGGLSGLGAMNLSPDQLIAVFEDEDPLAYTTFARQWLENRLTNANSIPVIEKQDRVEESATPFRNALIVTAILLATTAAMQVHGERRLSESKAVLSRMVQYEKQLKKDLDRSESVARLALDAQKEREALQKREVQRLSTIQRRQSEWLAATKRPSQVLKALETTADKSHWIQRIELNHREGMLSGLAIDCLSVSKLLARLETELGALVSEVQPAEMEVLSSNGLVQFELKLVLEEGLIAPSTPQLVVQGRIANRAH
ncbi:MAG: hypothetical protein ABJ015_09745 [Rhodopirellula bahusiensis]